MDPEAGRFVPLVDPEAEKHMKKLQEEMAKQGAVPAPAKPPEESHG